MSTARLIIDSTYIISEVKASSTTTGVSLDFGPAGFAISTGLESKSFSVYCTIEASTGALLASAIGVIEGVVRKTDQSVSIQSDTGTTLVSLTVGSNVTSIIGGVEWTPTEKGADGLITFIGLTPLLREGSGSGGTIENPSDMTGRVAYQITLDAFGQMSFVATASFTDLSGGSATDAAAAWHQLFFSSKPFFVDSGKQMKVTSFVCDPDVLDRECTAMVSCDVISARMAEIGTIPSWIQNISYDVNITSNEHTTHKGAASSSFSSGLIYTISGTIITRLDDHDDFSTGSTNEGKGRIPDLKPWIDNTITKAKLEASGSLTAISGLVITQTNSANTTTFSQSFIGNSNILAVSEKLSYNYQYLISFVRNNTGKDVIYSPPGPPIAQLQQYYSVVALGQTTPGLPSVPSGWIAINETIEPVTIQKFKSADGSTDIYIASQGLSRTMRALPDEGEAAVARGPREAADMKVVPFEEVFANNGRNNIGAGGADFGGRISNDFRPSTSDGDYRVIP